MLPTTGRAYVDTSAVIYGVDRVAPYAGLLLPLWAAARAGSLELCSSELTLMEALVRPLRAGDAALRAEVERVLLHAEIVLQPVTRQVLRDAADLRARHHTLRTPDAIHGATALAHGCTALVTNDPHFRRLAGVAVIILDELLG